MLSRRQFALAAALACVGCAAQKTTDAHGGGPSQTFKSVDTDGNGTLSQQEVYSWLDANGDDEVSDQEWNQIGKNPLGIDPADY